MGLTLREYADEPVKRDDMRSLREDIKRKWGTEGLHIAEVVEVGLPRMLIEALTGWGMSPAQVTRLATFFLAGADRWAIFIREDTNVNRVVRDIHSRLSTQPELLVGLFSMGRRAHDRLADIVSHLRKEGGYEIIVREEGPRTMVLISRADRTIKA